MRIINKVSQWYNVTLAVQNPQKCKQLKFQNVSINKNKLCTPLTFKSSPVWPFG